MFSICFKTNQEQIHFNTIAKYCLLQWKKTVWNRLAFAYHTLWSRGVSRDARLSRYIL